MSVRCCRPYVHLPPSKLIAHPVNLTCPLPKIAHPVYYLAHNGHQNYLKSTQFKPQFWPNWLTSRLSYPDTCRLRIKSLNELEINFVRYDKLFFFLFFIGTNRRTQSKGNWKAAGVHPKASFFSEQTEERTWVGNFGQWATLIYWVGKAIYWVGIYLLFTSLKAPYVIIIMISLYGVQTSSSSSGEASLLSCPRTLRA